MNNQTHAMAKPVRGTLALDAPHASRLLVHATSLTGSGGEMRCCEKPT